MAKERTIEKIKRAIKRDFAKLNLGNNPRPDVEDAENVNWVFPHGRLRHATDADMAETGMSFSVPARLAKRLAEMDRKREAQNPVIDRRLQQLPQQRLSGATILPERPEPFNCTTSSTGFPQGAIPKNRPRRTTYLGKVEWEWGYFPYYLHRGRGYWIVWTKFFCDAGERWEWEPVACVHHKGVSEKQAAVYLLMASWWWLTHWAEYDYGDKFHRINEEGYLCVAELEAIAREVWASEEEEEDEGTNNDGSDT